MTEKQSSALWQASIGNDAGLHDATPAPPTADNVRLAPPDMLSKVVLLVDSNPRTRESRAKVLQAMGVVVHSAASAATARTRLATSKFHLVLVDPGSDIEGAESLVAEIRLKDRKQRVAFLVGKPLYLASSLKREKPATAVPTPPLRKAPIAETKVPTLSDFGQRIKDAEAETI